MRIQPGLSRNVLTVGSAILLGTSLASCGEGKEINTKPVAVKKAEATYAERFHQASKVAKFTLNYLQTSKLLVKKDNERYYRIYFGNSCLKNTAYDISPKYIKGSLSGVSLTGSISGQIKGQIPGLQASIESNPEQPGGISVLPTDKRLPELDFTVSNDEVHLRAANDTTQNQLDLHECETGISKLTIGHE